MKLHEIFHNQIFFWKIDFISLLFQSTSDYINKRLIGVFRIRQSSMNIPLSRFIRAVLLEFNKNLINYRRDIRLMKFSEFASYTKFNEYSAIELHSND